VLFWCFCYIVIVVITRPSLHFYTCSSPQVGDLIVVLTRSSAAVTCVGVLLVVLPSGSGISRIVRPLRQLNSTKWFCRRAVPAGFFTEYTLVRQVRAPCCLRFSAEPITYGGTRWWPRSFPDFADARPRVGLSNSRIECSLKGSALVSQSENVSSALDSTVLHSLTRKTSCQEAAPPRTAYTLYMSALVGGSGANTWRSMNNCGSNLRTISLRFATRYEYTLNDIFIVLGKWKLGWQLALKWRRTLIVQFRL